MLKHGGCVGGRLEPEYKRWASMIRRCHFPKSNKLVEYGAKGIHVCALWRKSYPAFKAWARSHGFSPELQIDRINNKLGYSPSNCRFVTCKVNCLNRDRALNFNGLSTVDVAKRLRMTRGAIRARVKEMGLSLKQAMEMPPTPPGKRKFFWKHIGLWKEGE